MTSIRRLVACLSTVALVTACGGGGGSPSTGTTSPPPTTAPSVPGGLYVGYYQEDPLTNPEDPTAGAFSLNLPAGDSGFSGSMYFTYVGCQTSNVGAVGGTKSGLSLSGTWSGTVDALPQSGSFNGTYDTTTLTYSGTFTNAGGKQFRDLSPCIQYTIAPNGTWEMFAIDARVPSSFTTSVSARTVSWSTVAGAAYTLVYVLDPVIAQSTGNPVVWQTIVTSGTSTAIPNAVALQTGKQYIAVIAVSNAQYQRIAFGSIRFTH